VMTASARLTKLILTRDTDPLPPFRGALPPPWRGILTAKAEGRGARSAESATPRGAVSLGFGTFKNNRNRISGKNDSKGDATAFRAKV